MTFSKAAVPFYIPTQCCVWILSFCSKDVKNKAGKMIDQRKDSHWRDESCLNFLKAINLHLENKKDAIKL